MLKCRDILLQSQLIAPEELTTMHRLGMKMHLLMCRHCRRFRRQFQLMLAILPHFRQPADEQTVKKIMQKIEHDNRQD